MEDTQGKLGRNLKNHFAQKVFFFNWFSQIADETELLLLQSRQLLGVSWVLPWNGPTYRSHHLFVEGEGNVSTMFLIVRI